MTPTYKHKRLLHDFASEDRQQLIRHTKITPTLAEWFEVERRGEASRVDRLVLAACICVAAAFIAAWIAPDVAAWISGQPVVSVR